MNKIRVLFGFLLMSHLSACGIINLDKPGDLPYAPVEPDYPRVPSFNQGGIYHEANALHFFETVRARQVGDILVVELEEEAKGDKRSETKSQKDSNVNLQNPILLGKSVTFGKGFTLENQLNGTREFEGKGDSRQDHKLNGTITVSVYGVLPNGNLKIRGEKWIRINQGDEYIRLTGIIRGYDIRDDNTISSKKIANAEIVFTGKGQIADNNRSGWLQRFFTHPIWPY